jgi:hypothetical protein
VVHSRCDEAVRPKLDRDERIQEQGWDSQEVNEEQDGALGHIVQPLYTQ